MDIFCTWIHCYLWQFSFTCFAPTKHANSVECSAEILFISTYVYCICIFPSVYCICIFTPVYCRMIVCTAKTRHSQLLLPPWQKEVKFLVALVRLSVCPSVCLWTTLLKRYEWIWMKFYGVGCPASYHEELIKCLW